VLHKIRVGDVTLVFQGHRESVQFDCENTQARRYRESCTCVLKDITNTRLLWDYQAVEGTSDSLHKPRVDVASMVAFILQVGCPMLNASEVVSFLACLAGERAVEFFRWQMLDGLEAAVLNEHNLTLWSNMTSRHRQAKQQPEGAVSLKRKLRESDGSGGNKRRCMGNTVKAQDQDLTATVQCILGKRELNQAPQAMNASQPCTKRLWQSELVLERSRCSKTIHSA